MDQNVSDLLSEFEAIVDFISSGETPSPQDKNNVRSLWGKMLVKLDQKFIPEQTRFLQRRRLCAATQDFTNKEGKQLTVAHFEQTVDHLLEEDDPGCIQRYTASNAIIDQFRHHIAFLENFLAEAGPEEKKPRAKRIKKEQEEDPVPQKPLDRPPTPGVGFVSESQEIPITPATGKPVDAGAPKSSFQQVLDRAGQAS